MANITLTNATNVFDIPLNLIKAGKNVRSVEVNPKRFEEMMESFRKVGQMMPIEVQRTADGKFDIIAGFTRFAASKALEWPSIRAQVAEMPNKDPEKHRLLRGLAENLAREDLTTYDQSMNFVILKKEHDMSGTSIGQHVGRSTSYVNNLVRIAESCEPCILERWRKECDPNFGKDKEGKKLATVHQICTMDWLQEIAANVPRADQETALKKAMGLIPDDEEDGDDEDGDGTGTGARDPGAPKRASMKGLKMALAAAKEKAKEVKADEKEKLKGIIQGLEFAIGNNKTIVGVYVPKTKDDN